MATVGIEQLTLPISVPVSQQFESFVEGENSQLVTRAKMLLRQCIARSDCSDGPDVNQLFIHGGEGTGKSHLLFSLCHLANAESLPSFYLNMKDVVTLSTHVLEGLAYTPLLCVDDVHGISHDKGWQIALFDLINQRAEQRAGLTVFASRFPPTHKGGNGTLPDLQSRLSWGETYVLNPLNESAQIRLLEQLARLRGLRLTHQASLYIIHHCERSNKALVKLIERLDKRSLQEQKPLSINLIKRELGI
ncbi:HdaA/DnaA family protein [Alteromonas oceanisediminis]|uniref:HdaA/DnaA family protein n=1 Tax=Alteromonas oceanisediminis TaxID=2836180 RepID=UPI001BDB60D8|nr:DnaA/Hda family protein [Alteromonas oceanisediminis]MBT0586374.1 hypothetical protein [Alteromonas oceanisediminis]